MSTIKGCAGRSHIGHGRSDNEDRFLIAGWPDQNAVLAVVADGMGSYGGGDLAAQTIVDSFGKLTKSRLPERRSERYELFLGAFYQADDEVRAIQSTTFPEMGATVAAAIVTEEELLHLYAGDCRMYHFSRSAPPYITRDHSVVQALVDSASISADQALSHPLRSVVTSCIGGPARNTRLTVDPKPPNTLVDENMSSGPFRFIGSGDQLMLCCDGLWSELNSDQMTNTLFRTRLTGENIEDVCDEIFRLALSGVAADNLTGVFIDIDELRQGFAVSSDPHTS